jgi:hypothetical protein
MLSQVAVSCHFVSSRLLNIHVSFQFDCHDVIQTLCLVQPFAEQYKKDCSFRIINNDISSITEISQTFERSSVLRFEKEVNREQKTTQNVYTIG